MSSHSCQSAIGHSLSEGLDSSRTGSVMCLALSGRREDGEVAGGSIYSLASTTSSCRIRIRADCRPSVHAARQPGCIDSVDGPYSTQMRCNRSTGTPSREADCTLPRFQDGHLASDSTQRPCPMANGRPGLSRISKCENHGSLDHGDLPPSSCSVLS